MLIPFWRNYGFSSCGTSKHLYITSETFSLQKKPRILHPSTTANPSTILALNLLISRLVTRSWNACGYQRTAMAHVATGSKTGRISSTTSTAPMKLMALPNAKFPAVGFSVLMICRCVGVKYAELAFRVI